MAWSVVEFPVPEPTGEACAEALRLAGADGVSEEWRQGRTYVRGFWKDTPEERALADARVALHTLVEVGLLPEEPATVVTTMEDQDWLEGWKQYFSPIQISPRLAITPSWEAYTPEYEQAVVTLDPGMAFGTGTHGTTFTCLKALADHLAPGSALCDVGTGSGILAIAAVKLGAGRVVATDNDELSIRVARENAALNGVEACIDFREADLLTGVDAPFDVVIANILAPVIALLIPQLPAILRPGGLFISSGYIVSQEADLLAAMQAHGHTHLARYEHEGWVTQVTRYQA